jgi:anti-sigma-K factor RskA
MAMEPAKPAVAGGRACQQLCAQVIDLTARAAASPPAGLTGAGALLAPRRRWVGRQPQNFVAVLQKDAASPAFILTVDLAAKSFNVRSVSAEPQPGKSYELWLVSDKFPAPKSLGLLGPGTFNTRRSLAPYDPALVSNATFAVSVEPQGGSPSGLPTGPVVYAGKLIQAPP